MGFTQLRAKIIFGANALQTAHLFPHRLDRLLELRNQLVHNIGSLDQEFHGLEILAYCAWMEALQLQASTLLNAQPVMLEPNVLVPSLHLPWQEQAGPLQDAILACIADLIREARAVHERFLQQKLQLRRVNKILAILQRLSHSFVPFFCGVRWERRQFFLRHGAHPPKQSLPARQSLFTGARSSSLLAH